MQYMNVHTHIINAIGYTIAGPLGGRESGQTHSHLTCVNQPCSQVHGITAPAGRVLCLPRTPHHALLSLVDTAQECVCVCVCVRDQHCVCVCVCVTSTAAGITSL